MTETADGGNRIRVLPWTRILFVVTIVAALTLGYIGIKQYVTGSDEPDLGAEHWDLLYYDLQLFVLGSQPLQFAGPYPLALEFARFAAPAATIYALFETARVLFHRQFTRWREGRARGHAIVIGDSVTARAQAAALRERGQRVIHRPHGDRSMLVGAGAGRATTLHACADDTDDGLANLAAATAAATIQRRVTPPLKIYVQVSDSEFALALRARTLSLGSSQRSRVDFFNPDELAARHVLQFADVVVDASQPAHIVVAGLGAFGRAVIVEYVRLWLIHSPRRTERVTVTMLGDGATGIAELLRQRWDLVASTCDLQPVDSGLFAVDDGPPPHRVFICHDDDREALHAALTRPEFWQGGEGSVIVRLNHLHRHSEAFGTTGHPLLDTVDGRLRLVNVASLAAQRDLSQEDMVEWLAKSIHDSYLVEQLRRGVLMASTPTMLPWHELEPEIAESNRDQARHIGDKLKRIPATLAPKSGHSDFSFTSTEIELLAQDEHLRWVRERVDSGWRYAEIRDDSRKEHPALVDWAVLSEELRDRDRDTVRNIPRLVGDLGLRIVRLR